MLPSADTLTEPGWTILRDEDAVPDTLAERLVAWRRHLHRHPEIGMEEHETSRFVEGVLAEDGLEPVTGLAGGTGLYVDIVGQREGPRVAYRADMDALPMADAKAVPYRSQREGVAHLCGHDAHTTLALGVALLLHRHREHLRGSVRVFFQPNEERMPSGAPLMIADGVLDGVEAAYAAHVDPHRDLGVYGVRVGNATASADTFDVVVRAKASGHSARPHETVDTVWLATMLLQQLYTLAGRVTDARQASVLTVCRFRAGEAYNVIPPETVFGGTLRCASDTARRTLRHRMETLVREVAEVHGATAEVRWTDGAPPVLNDARLAENMRASITDLFGKDAVDEIRLPSMGAEDFAYYAREVPGLLLRVGTASGPDTRFPLHDAQFDLDERALAPTARLMATALLRHLEAGVLG